MILKNTNPDLELAFLKGYLKALKYNQALLALSIAEEKHKGVKRKSGEDYIIHPVRIASALISLNILDEEVLIAVILHDVLEDTDTTADYLRKFFDNSTVEIIELLTKEKGVDIKVYINKISLNYKASLIKIADRCHNVSTMQYFNSKKIDEYIKETIEYILPLCSSLSNTHPEWSNQAYYMKYHLESLLALSTAFLK